MVVLCCQVAAPGISIEEALHHHQFLTLASHMAATGENK